MEVARYVTIQAVKTDTNELIPIWDGRIIYGKDDLIGKYVVIDRKKYFDFVDCIYDLKTKEISSGIELNIYPKDLKYSIGMNVLIEKSGHKLTKVKIVDITYENFDLRIKRGNKIEKYELNYNSIEILSDAIYSIKNWTPCYVFDNGTKTEYDHKIYIME